jgi:Rrf2 family protein
MMKLTTRGRYAVKAMLDLTLQPRYGPASVKAIAHRQQLPAPYLEKLLIELRQAGLVRSIRGSQGGYQLAKKPRAIALGTILEAVGESLEAIPREPLNPEQAEDWVTEMLWTRLNEKFKAAIFTITLEDLYFDARSWQAAQEGQSNFII